jgi:hypothetical protein
LKPDAFRIFISVYHDAPEALITAGHHRYSLDNRKSVLRRLTARFTTGEFLFLSHPFTAAPTEEDERMNTVFGLGPSLLYLQIL